MAAASDGTKLNLAAALAEAAASLEKTAAVRAGRAEDPALVSALEEVRAAVRSLSAAVRILAGEVSER